MISANESTVVPLLAMKNIFKGKKIERPIGKYFIRVEYKNWFIGTYYAYTKLRNGLKFTSDNYSDILQDAKENRLHVTAESLAGII